MKANKWIWGVLAILLGVGMGTAGAATNEVSALLQQGLFEEEANQNLDAAIQAYQAVIAQTDKNRQFAATAIFRLGECYRKQGKTNEAAAQYQRILRDFADQTQLAKLSQQNLEGMGMTSGGASNSPGSGNGDASTEASVLAGQISAIEQMKDNPVEQARGVLAMFPDDGLKKMLENLPRLQEQEAKIKASPGQTLQSYRIALDPNGSIMAQPPATPFDSEHAEAETKLQLSLIQKRVDFIMANQKARLKVLQLAGADTALQQRQLLEEEIRLLEIKVKSQQARVNQGILSSDELSNTQQHLLELKRQLAALESGQPISAAAPELNDEDKELARIQGMMLNTPDLITGSSAELIQAAEAGYLRVAAFLLDHGANVNGSPADNGHPLIHAARRDQKTMVELLLSRGADINARDNSGETALMVAVENGYKSVVEDLLAHHADLNGKRNGGYTALSLAVQKGYPDTASLLITNGADVNAADDYGYTPLFGAATAGNTAVMELLIAHKAEVDAKDNIGLTPLFSAVQAGQIDAASLLLKKGADVNALATGGGGQPGKGWSPLHVAVAGDEVGMVKLLLEYDTRTDLRVPVYANQFTQGRGYGFSQLGANGMQPYVGGNANPFPGDENVPPLTMAVMNGRKETVQLLIEHHADVNARASAGDSALMMAAKMDYPNGGGQPTRDRLGIAELLLDNGADVNLQNDDLESALGLAARNNLPEMVKLILAHKPNVDIFDKNGWTPLHSAVADQQVEIAGMLLDAGANPNRKYAGQFGPIGLFGRTLLTGAVEMNNKDLVEVLLAHHADPNAPDDSRDTPLSLARRDQKFYQDPQRLQTASAIVDLLLKAGANENLHRLSTISVSRAGNERTVFTREPNLPNHFTLLDLVCEFYAPLLRHGPPNGTPLQELPGVAFPDFGRIQISRLQKDGRTNVIRVDLESVLDAGDCSKDVLLEWGDIVEVPEADHNVNEQWTGLSDAARSMLRKCLASQVVIMVKGQTNLVMLKPLMYRRNSPRPFGSGGGEFGRGEITYGRQMVGPNGYAVIDPRDNPAEQPSFWLYDVVHEANVILTSSDLSRVKITRKDAATRKTIELTLDLQKSDPANALWLRDGDVIEIPEKP
jgi:ankyrin repeat protein